jgi:Na+/melibiose symporter-like transporter
MFFAVIVAMSVVSIGVRPLVAQFSSERAGFFAVAVMFAVVSTVLLLFSFTRTEERVPPPREQYRVRDMLRIVLKNDALLMLSAAMFLNTCVWVIGSAVALYYFKYVVGNADLQTSFFFWMLPANIVGAALSPWLAKRLGKRNAFILGSFLVAFFYVIRHFVADQSLVAIISVSMAASFGQMLCSITQWAMLPDTVEYGHYRSGIRSEGLPFALFAFTQKLGMATGGALAALVMTFTGYAANATQSATALVGIRWLFNLVPALFSIACLLVLLVYKLDEKRYAEIQAALAKQESGS